MFTALNESFEKNDLKFGFYEKEVTVGFGNKQYSMMKKYLNRDVSDVSKHLKKLGINFNAN